VVFLVFLSPGFGREIVYLANGFTFEVDSHTQSAQTVVCQTLTGTLELRLSDIAAIESLPETRSLAAVAGAQKTTPEDVLVTAATDQGLPPELIRSVAKIESGFRQDAVSRSGAIGLMQLMPGTAAQLGVQPSRVEENASGGAKYLRDLLLRYHYDSALALAAYNAGPGAVDKYRGVPPYIETRQYVLKVLREYEREHRLETQAKTAHDRAVSASRPISIN
jgi:soluble lytic murein transglycosylase-like protein